MYDILNGIQVLEFANLLPGPLTGLLLRNFGAEVIKIEPPEGDPVRKMNNGIYFKSLNRGKKSISINLKTKNGKHQFIKLIQHANILIDGHRPVTLNKLNLAPKDLLQQNPSLIILNLNGYGSHKDHRQRAGHDINYISISGILSMLREENKKPIIPGFQLANTAGSLFSVIVILLALIRQIKNNKGGYYSIPISESALLFSSLFSNQNNIKAGKTWVNGLYPCYNVYQSSDGIWYALGAFENTFWLEFLNIIKKDDLIDKQYDPEIIPIITKCFSRYDSNTWDEYCKKNNLCLEKIYEAHELENTQHWKNRDKIFKDKNGDAIIQFPYFNNELLECVSPELGEHNELIFQNPK